MKLIKMTELDKALATEGFKLASGSGPIGTSQPRKPMSAAHKAKIAAGVKRSKIASPKT